MAKTKRQRLEAKRGRPRKDGEREPNGRLSRSGRESIDQLALDTRARRMGIGKDQAKDQKAGSFIGYLNLIGPRDGGLSDAQYEGAQQYLRHRQRVARALLSPAAIYDPEAPAGEGIDTEAYASWCKDVLDEDKTIRQQIQEEQNYSRDNLWAALDLVVLQDKPMYAMIGATRALCNVFARHFRTAVDNRHAA